MATAGPTIYLVDDDEQILKALGRLLSGAHYTVQSYTSAEAFLDHHDPDIHGCAVLDLRLGGMDGLEIQERLISEMMLRPIVFLTGQGDVPTSVQAMKGGAVDFLTKPVDGTALLSAIGIALRMDLSQRRQAADRKTVETCLARLTPRERQVLDHVVAGRLNKQIAFDLGIAEKTIKVHRARIMQKMGVGTIADLVRIVTLHSGRDGSDGGHWTEVQLRGPDIGV